MLVGLITFVFLFFTFVSTETDLTPGKLKSLSDSKLSKGDLDGALELLNKLIMVQPDEPKNYYKRFRVHVKKMQYEEAIHDLTEALRLNPSYELAQSQKAKLLLKMGECEASVLAFRQLGQLKPDHKDLGMLQKADQCAALTRQAKEAIKRRQYQQARDLLDRAIELTDFSVPLLLQKAETLYSMEYYEEAVADLGRVLKVKGNHLDALELRGKAHYQLRDYDMAKTHFREALKLDPEHKGCKENFKKVKAFQKTRKKADTAMSEERWEESLPLLEELLRIDPQHKGHVFDILCELSKAHTHLNQLNEAERRARQAVELNEASPWGFTYLGRVFYQQENFEEAVRMFRLATERQGHTQEQKEELRKAEVALKQSKEKNYYKILGVERTASKKVIKTAYRKLALEYHPDKMQGGEEERKSAEVNFELIAEAYEVLGDEEMRAKYDRGEDVFGNQQQQQHHQRGNPFFHFGGQRQHFSFKFG